VTDNVVATSNTCGFDALVHLYEWGPMSKIHCYDFVWEKQTPKENTFYAFDTSVFLNFWVWNMKFFHLFLGKFDCLEFRSVEPIYYRGPHKLWNIMEGRKKF